MIGGLSDSLGPMFQRQRTDHDGNLARRRARGAEAFGETLSYGRASLEKLTRTPPRG